MAERGLMTLMLVVCVACSEDHSEAGAGSNDAGRIGSSAGEGGDADVETGGRGGSAGKSSAGSAGKPSAGSGGSVDTGPAPSSSWVNATGNLANMASECGNLTMLSAVPGTGAIIAGVAKHGLFQTDDAGKTWK